MSYGRNRYDIDGDEVHYPTRPVDRDKADSELTINIKKATSPDETAPKQKHVRSALFPPLSLTLEVNETLLQNALFIPGIIIALLRSGQA